MKDETAEKGDTTSDNPTKHLAEVEGKSQGVSPPADLPLTKALSPKHEEKEDKGGRRRLTSLCVAFLFLSSIKCEVFYK